MHKRDWVSFGYWAGIGTALWIIAWIIAEAIPVFQNLLSLVVCCRQAFPKCPIPADNLLQASLFASWSTCTHHWFLGEDATR
jgi:hypothetical protein